MNCNTGTALGLWFLAVGSDEESQVNQDGFLDGADSSWSFREQPLSLNIKLKLVLKELVNDKAVNEKDWGDSVLISTTVGN